MKIIQKRKINRDEHQFVHKWKNHGRPPRGDVGAIGDSENYQYCSTVHSEIYEYHQLHFSVISVSYILPNDEEILICKD